MVEPTGPDVDTLCFLWAGLLTFPAKIRIFPKVERNDILEILQFFYTKLTYRQH